MLGARPTAASTQPPSISLNVLLLSRAQLRSMHTNDISDNKTNRPITRHYLPTVGLRHANLQK